MCTAAQIKFPATVAKTNDGGTEYDKWDDTSELTSKSSFSPPFESPAQHVSRLSNSVQPVLLVSLTEYELRSATVNLGMCCCTGTPETMGLGSDLFRAQ